MHVDDRFLAGRMEQLSEHGLPQHQPEQADWCLHPFLREVLDASLSGRWATAVGEHANVYCVLQGLCLLAMQTSLA